MKRVLAAAALLFVTLPFTAPAAAFDGAYDAPALIRDNGWDDSWRERRGDGWRERRGDDRYERRSRWEDRDDRLSERQIARRLMRQGFVRIDDIDRRRDRYIVRAVRPNGALIRLAVDAYDGEIVSRERIGWVAGGRGYDGDPRRPVSGVEFDLGNGTLGFYSR